MIIIRKIFLLILIILVSGCAGWIATFHYHTAEEVAKKNRKSLLLISGGMKKEKVLSIMGTGSVALRFEGYYSIPNPYKIENMEAVDGQVYEIIYYFTYQADDHDSVDLEKECTPLIFKNDILIDWGKTALEDLIKGRR